MNKALLLIQVTTLTLFFACKTDSETNSNTEYLRWIGDIEHDSSSDGDQFKVCNGEDNVLQYFNVGKGPVYFGEKPSLIRAFKTQYKPVTGKNQSGMIRIRFIVNCEGVAGRFRVMQADSDYKETKFKRKIISQLTEITKGIKRWVVLEESGKEVDYYYYLIFKLEDGQITEILP